LTPARALLAAEAVVVLALVLALALASGCTGETAAATPEEPPRWGLVSEQDVDGPFGVVIYVFRDSHDGRCWALPYRSSGGDGPAAAAFGPVPCSAPSAAPAAALMPEGE
jgi:hypothetical protein